MDLDTPPDHDKGNQQPNEGHHPQQEVPQEGPPPPPPPGAPETPNIFADDQVFLSDIAHPNDPFSSENGVLSFNDLVDDNNKEFIPVDVAPDYLLQPNNNQNVKKVTNTNPVPNSKDINKSGFDTSTIVGLAVLFAVLLALGILAFYLGMKRYTSMPGFKIGWFSKSSNKNEKIDAKDLEIGETEKEYKTDNEPMILMNDAAFENQDPFRQQSPFSAASIQKTQNGLSAGKQSYVSPFYDQADNFNSNFYMNPNVNQLFEGDSANNPLMNQNVPVFSMASPSIPFNNRPEISNNLVDSPKLTYTKNSSSNWSNTIKENDTTNDIPTTEQQNNVTNTSQDYFTVDSSKRETTAASQKYHFLSKSAIARLSSKLPSALTSPMHRIHGDPRQPVEQPQEPTQIQDRTLTPTLTPPQQQQENTGFVENNILSEGQGLNTALFTDDHLSPIRLIDDSYSTFATPNNLSSMPEFISNPSGSLSSTTSNVGQLPPDLSTENERVTLTEPQKTRPLTTISESEGVIKYSIEQLLKLKPSRLLSVMRDSESRNMNVTRLMPLQYPILQGESDNVEEVLTDIRLNLMNSELDVASKSIEALRFVALSSGSSEMGNPKIFFLSYGILVEQVLDSGTCLKLYGKMRKILSCALIETIITYYVTCWDFDSLKKESEIQMMFEKLHFKPYCLKRANIYKYVVDLLITGHHTSQLLEVLIHFSNPPTPHNLVMVLAEAEEKSSKNPEIVGLLIYLRRLVSKEHNSCCLKKNPIGLAETAQSTLEGNNPFNPSLPDTGVLRSPFYGKRSALPGSLTDDLGSGIINTINTGNAVSPPPYIGSPK